MEKLEWQMRASIILLLALVAFLTFKTYSTADMGPIKAQARMLSKRWSDAVEENNIDLMRVLTQNFMYNMEKSIEKFNEYPISSEKDQAIAEIVFWQRWALKQPKFSKAKKCS